MIDTYENLLNKAKEQIAILELSNQGSKVQVIITKEVVDLSITSFNLDHEESIISFVEEYTEKDILDLQNSAYSLSEELGIVYETLDLRVLNS